MAYVNVIDDFIFDMADEFDITFKKANDVIGTILDVQKAVNPSVGKARLQDALVSLIKNDYESGVALFTDTLNNPERYTKIVTDYEVNKALRGMDRVMKSIAKMY